MNNLERFRFEAMKVFASATKKEIKQFFEGLPCLPYKRIKLLKKMEKLHQEACEKGKYKSHCPEEVDCCECEEEWLNKEWQKRTPISNREELARLILENPELPVLCMVEFEIVASDECLRWAASLGECKIREYIYHENGLSDSVIYWREDAGKLVDVLAEDAEEHPEYYPIGEDPQTATARAAAYANARMLAEQKVRDLPWKKAIVVNIDLPEEV